MLLADPPRVGYVLKRYPRHSETFIVNEILAHEAAGLAIEIFSLRPPNDGHFQDAIARVRAPVTYLPIEGLKAVDLWTAIQGTADIVPDLWTALRAAHGEDGRDVYQAAVLARETRLRGISHLHAHFASAATTVTRLAAHFARLPYTFTAHAKDIFHESVQPDDLAAKLSDATGVVTVSDYNVDYLERAFGPTGVRRIYNGLDLDRFRYQAPIDRPSRIISVGRLVEKKGFADLIEACAILVGRGRRFTCQIVGAGPLEAELREQIERLGLQSMVELLGPRPQDEIIPLVRGAAVFAAPCIIGADNNRDGLPTVLLEAMALGTPCVSTDVTGIPEVLHDGETGVMVPQHAPVALAAAFERLLDDAKLRVRLAVTARTLIEREFDVHRNAAQVRELFGAAGRVRAASVLKVS